jgi:hypothetical protein
VFILLVVPLYGVRPVLHLRVASIAKSLIAVVLRFLLGDQSYDQFEFQSVFPQQKNLPQQYSNLSRVFAECDPRAIASSCFPKYFPFLPFLAPAYYTVQQANPQPLS